MSFAKGAALSDQVHDPNHTFVRSLIDLKGTVEAPEIWEVVDKIKKELKNSFCVIYPVW